MYRTRYRGISLLELMITIVLLTTVLITFAAVYPSGYRLNRKAAQHTIAAQTAQAVVEELQNLPLTNDLGGLSLRQLQDGFDGPTAEFPRTAIPEGFELKDVKVTTYDLGTGTDPVVFANLEVTVSYRDARTRGDEDINVTVTAAVTINQR